VTVAQAEVEDIDEEESTPVAGHQLKKRGRKPLDSALPREIVRHELPEAERVCAHDGHALVEIGAEVSEQMDVPVYRSDIENALTKTLGAGSTEWLSTPTALLLEPANVP